MRHSHSHIATIYSFSFTIPQSVPFSEKLCVTNSNLHTVTACRKLFFFKFKSSCDLRDMLHHCISTIAQNGKKTMACLINSMLQPQWSHLSRRGNGQNTQELLCWLATAQDWVMSVDLDRQWKHITQSLQRDHLGFWDYKTHLARAKCALGGKDGGEVKRGREQSIKSWWRTKRPVPFKVDSLEFEGHCLSMSCATAGNQAGEEPSTTWRWQRKRLDGFGWKEMTNGGQ